MRSHYGHTFRETLDFRNWPPWVDWAALGWIRGCGFSNSHEAREVSSTPTKRRLLNFLVSVCWWNSEELQRRFSDLAPLPEHVSNHVPRSTAGV